MHLRPRRVAPRPLITRHVVRGIARRRSRGLRVGPRRSAPLLGRRRWMIATHHGHRQSFGRMLREVSLQPSPSLWILTPSPTGPASAHRSPAIRVRRSARR